MVDDCTLSTKRTCENCVHVSSFQTSIISPPPPYRLVVFAICIIASVSVVSIHKSLHFVISPLAPSSGSHFIIPLSHPVLFVVVVVDLLLLMWSVYPSLVVVMYFLALSRGSHFRTSSMDIVSRAETVE